MKKYFKEISVPVDVKYIDPTYMIRACRANASDGILCTVLGQNAVSPFLSLQCINLITAMFSINCGCYAIEISPFLESDGQIITYK